MHGVRVRRHRGTAARSPSAALVLLVVLTLPVAGCGASEPAARPPSNSAAEPQTAPSPQSKPVGAVLAIGDTPEGVVIDDVTRLAVVALRDPDSLALVNLQHPQDIRRISTPGRARHLRLAAPGGPVLLPGEDTNVLSEIALPSGRIVERFTTRRQPHDAVLVNGQLWVTDELAGTVTVLGANPKTLPAGLQPGGLGAAANRVAVADVRGNKLYVFDTATQKQIAALPAGAGPTHVVQVGRATVAVADTRGNAVLLYDLSDSPRLVARLALPGGPYGLAADQTRNRLWVALSGRNQLVEVAVATDRLRPTGRRFATVQQPNSVAVSPQTGELAIAGATRKGTLQLLTPGGVTAVRPAARLPGE